jgi:hypothetical protein
MDNYGAFNISRCLSNLMLVEIDSKLWESKKVGKGKTPQLRSYFSWYFDSKVSNLTIFKGPRLYIHGGALINI